MKRDSTPDRLDTGCTGDYARIETAGECILLEANEWDAGFNGFRSVTLILTPSEARSLAGRLALSVIAIESTEIPGSPKA